MAKKIKDDDISLGDFARELSEKVRLQAIRPNIYGYAPHHKQMIFHQHERRHRLYIGGNRSGKTTGGIAEDVMWLRGQHPYRPTPEPPIRGRIVGVDFINGVEKILKPEFMRWCPISELRGGSWYSAYDANERVVNFENGSTVEFMSYDQDVDKFAGTSRHFVHFDEEPPEDIFIECRARLVDTGGSWWMTLTPIEGMEWMYDTIYLTGMTDPTSNIGVIEVDMHENPYLDEAEIKDFLESLSEDDKDARVKGKFIRRGGLIYKSFSRDQHVIPPLKSIPKHGDLYTSMDHGFNNPTAWLWFWVDGDGNVIVFDEHYESEMTIDLHADIVKYKEVDHGRTPLIRVGDPAIAQRNAVTGDSVQAQYAQHGLYIQLANNEVLAGINKVNSYLTRRRQDGRPRLLITENCTNLINEKIRYRWKTWANKKSERQNNKYDIPHKKDDHACDAVRYFFTLMPDLTPFKYEEMKQELPKIGPDPVDPYGYRIDQNLLKQPEIQSEWHIQAYDEYMGAEW